MACIQQDYACHDSTRLVRKHVNIEGEAMSENNGGQGKLEILHPFNQLSVRV